MSVDETLAASRRLDRLLAGERTDKMPGIGGSKIVGEIGGLVADVQKILAEAKLGIAGALAEFTTEVSDLRNVEVAIRAEAKAVRDLKTSILGNATGGENSTEQK